MSRYMKLRGNSGQHSFELVAGLLVLVPVVLYTIDYAVVLYAGAMNDNCCTAAARAAASGPPTYYTNSGGSTPTTRAQAVLAKVSQPGGVIRMQDSVHVAENITQPYPSTGTGGFGGPILGNVTVKTQCNVYPPFALPFVPSSLSLYTSQTFPWTWVMPANYQSVGSGQYNNM